MELEKINGEDGLMTTVDFDIDYLIEEINSIITKFSVRTDKLCKHCGFNHYVISVDCGTPVYWFDGETPILDGERISPPEGAIYYNDWIRGL